MLHTDHVRLSVLELLRIPPLPLSSPAMADWLRNKLGKASFADEPETATLLSAVTLLRCVCGKPQPACTYLPLSEDAKALALALHKHKQSTESSIESGLMDMGLGTRDLGAALVLIAGNAGPKKASGVAETRTVEALDEMKHTAHTLGEALQRAADARSRAAARSGSYLTTLIADMERAYQTVCDAAIRAERRSLTPQPSGGQAAQEALGQAKGRRRGLHRGCRARGEAFVAGSGVRLRVAALHAGGVPHPSCAARGGLARNRRDAAPQVVGAGHLLRAQGVLCTARLCTGRVRFLRRGCARPPNRLSRHRGTRAAHQHALVLTHAHAHARGVGWRDAARPGSGGCGRIAKPAHQERRINALQRGQL